MRAERMIVSTHSCSAARRLDRADLVVDRVLDDVGEVLALLVERVRVVHGERAVQRAHVQTVREAAVVHAVQRAHAVLPLLGERQPVAAVDLVAGAAREVGADLEAGGVDQAVDLVLHAVRDHALLGDALDALALRVDQRDVRAVEGVEILVVEARPLAELAVVGLQRLGGVRVLRRSRPRARGSAPSSRSPRARASSRRRSRRSPRPGRTAPGSAACG